VHDCRFGRAGAVSAAVRVHHTIIDRLKEQH
jgi:hypothetical protein